MSRSPFTVNWNNKQAVIDYCDELDPKGDTCLVIKHPDRDNYGITFIARIDHYVFEDVIEEHKDRRF